MTVWGVLIMQGVGQRRAVVATRTKAEAAQALGVSRYYLDKYGSATLNDSEVAVANASPGTVFVMLGDVSHDPMTAEWRPLGSEHTKVVL